MGGNYIAGRPTSARSSHNLYSPDGYFFAARTGQEPSIGRQGIQGTKELEASDECTHKGIHGDHTFCFEFAERHVNGPLIRAGGAQAGEG